MSGSTITQEDILNKQNVNTSSIEEILKLNAETKAELNKIE